MFKVARWRSEKNKAKAVFKLQFQATKVPQWGSETMMISLVPADVGRPTARSEKVAVVDGACTWVNPVYETVKLVRNSTSGKMDEKVYKFLLSATGSSKAGLLGEVTVNLAAYAEVFEAAASLSLPLKASNYTGTVLHITIQRIQGDCKGREGDEDGEAMVKRQRRILQSQLSKCNNEEDSKASNGMMGINFTSDGSHINSQARVKFASSRDIPIHVDCSGSLQKSHSFDTISASDSDTNLPRENGIKHNNHQKDPTSFLSPITNSGTPKKMMSNSGDWSGTSATDGNADASTSSSVDAGLNETSCDSEQSLERLRSDIVFLTRKVEVSDLELQTLRKRIIKESQRGQDLSREVSGLKEERDALKRECEQLKLSESQTKFDRNISTGSQHGGEDQISLLEEIKQELDHEKNLNVHLRLQLKIMQESNSDLMLAVKDLGLLEQKNKETLCMKCSKMDHKTETDKELEAMTLGNGLPPLQKSECKQQLPKMISKNDNEGQCALDALVNEHDDMKISYPLKNKIIDLDNEEEFYRKYHEDLEMQMEQLALEYEILKQENHDITTKLEQMQLREQLRVQYECSAHLTIINDLESHVECLEKELQKQAEAFEADIATITHAKVEQEKRAILAVEALRKAKWNNSNIVEQLQEEIRSLSAHMSSTFQVNEKIIEQVLKETTELRSQKSNLEKLLEKTNKDLVSMQDQYRTKLKQLVCLTDFKSKEADKLVLELKDMQRERENYKMSEEAMRKNYLEEVQVLKTEMERLKSENFLLSEKNEEKENLLVEMELLKTSTRRTEMSLQDKILEIDLLKKEKEVLRGEINKSLEEKNELLHIKDKKDTMIAMLKYEAANLGLQYYDLKQVSYENELEKQNLRTSLSHLGGGLLEEPMTTNWEEKLDDSYTTSTTHDDEHFHQSLKCASKDDVKCTTDYLQQSKEDKEFIHDMNRTDKELLIRYTGTDLDKENQVAISCMYDRKKITEVLSEMELMRKQNESMQSELKAMQERYCKISLKFAEAEGERQQLTIKIQTLQNALKN